MLGWCSTPRPQSQSFSSSSSVKPPRLIPQSSDHWVFIQNQPYVHVCEWQAQFTRHAGVRQAPCCITVIPTPTNQRQGEQEFKDSLGYKNKQTKFHGNQSFLWECRLLAGGPWARHQYLHLHSDACVLSNWCCTRTICQTCVTSFTFTTALRKGSISSTLQKRKVKHWDAEKVTTYATSIWHNLPFLQVTTPSKLRIIVRSCALKGSLLVQLEASFLICSANYNSLVFEF